jgi:hypothetical protein
MPKDNSDKGAGKDDGARAAAVSSASNAMLFRRTPAKKPQSESDFAQGGEQVLAHYKLWATMNHMAKGSITGLYWRKLRQIFGYWEETMPNFVVDKLLYMYESQTTFQTLNFYLPTEKSTSAQKVAIQSYLHLIKFLRERVTTIYAGAGQDVPIVERAAILDNLNMCEVIKHCLKSLNRQYGEQHAKSVEAKVVNKAELKYNPDEMQKILKELLGSETLKEMMEEFSNGGLGRMADEGLIDKKEACYFILSILLVEGLGQRHSAYANMT